MAQISPKQHYAVYARIASKGILTPSASQYLWNRDDFITPNPDLVHQRFEWLLYTTRPYLWVSLTPELTNFIGLPSTWLIAFLRVK